MISILLAVYNGEKYIHQSINSILNQTLSDWELLVGFNGTTDNSKKIVSEYTDSRIKIFDYGDDKGKAKTLNKLIKEANHDWCAIQDDDDVWLPEKLETQIKYTKNYDVVGTYIKYINENGETIGGPFLSETHDQIKTKSLAGNNQIANSSSIFKKECVESVGLWSEEKDGVEDFDLWLKLLKNDFMFYNIPQYLCLHRIHSESNFNTKEQNVNKIL